MKKEYTLNGLDCAHCGTQIENTINKLSFIKSANVNFVSTTLIVETEGNRDHIKEIKEEIRKIDSDITLEEKNKNKTVANVFGKEEKKDLSRILVGLIIFTIGFIFEKTATINEYGILLLYIISYLILGGNVLLRAIKNMLRGKVFDENFLMSIATLGAFGIGAYAEAVGVMLFYQIGEFFQDIAVKRSRKSITELMDIRPDYANLKVDGKTNKVAPEEVKVGDYIVVKPGEKVPLDGKVIEGRSILDTRALTGESAPRKAEVGDMVISGCINTDSLLTLEVIKSYKDSTVAKIIDMVENAGNKKAPTENFITKFAAYYTPVVVILALFLSIIPPLLFGGDWADWINRGLIFLVISCPCALVISIPLSFFGGIGGASKQGILVKGGNYLEALNNLDIVVFDKTGTLTKGIFKVTGIFPADRIKKEELLELAAYGEFYSNHPIAESIKKQYKEYKEEYKEERISDYQELAGYGIKVKIDENIILLGNQKLMEKNAIEYLEAKEIGTKVYLAKNNEFIGYLVIADEIKKDSKKAIAMLKERGIEKTVMLTGDNREIGEGVGKQLGLDEVYSELLPQDKVEIVEKLEKTKKENRKLAFVGDGINDAPVLARSDIGIAMGGLGSDAAIEAADIVLMTDEPSKLVEALDIARFTRKIVWQNIIFALGIKGLFLIMGALGAANMWEAVFADVGVSLIAILNATRAMKIRNKS